MLIVQDPDFEAGHFSPDVYVNEDRDIRRASIALSGLTLNVEADFDDFHRNNHCISRETFDRLLAHPEMQAMLASADIDTAYQADLFDVLDVDMANELELGVLARGLMTMRGPITKSDIVATRLMSKQLVDQLEDVTVSLKLIMSKISCKRVD